MPNGSRERVLFDGRCVGIILLLIVNVLWVLSAEITRFIFVDEDFKRPFFTAYLKSCLLSVYMVRYLACSSGRQTNVYKVLENEEKESFEMANTVCLSDEGFETVTESESDSEGVASRRISFAPQREVRRLPSVEAEDAQRARLPYSPPLMECNCQLNIPLYLKYTVFFFAPMWLVCSFTYQTALLFTSVSSLNLISSSSSLFVLVLSICIPSNGAKFTLFKAILVALNLSGVIAVSQFSGSLTGAIFAQVSAIAYALYLTIYSRYIEKHGELNMNLMFGTIGVLAVVIGSPLLLVLDVTGVEALYPLPNWEQLGCIVVSALFGTLLADYLWLLAASLTDSLSASLSMTLSIPLSFLADSLFRSRPPSLIQLLAAIPITLSFVGAAVADHRSASRPAPSDDVSETTDDRRVLLMDGDDEVEE